jgi:hypothetical protein
MPHRLVCVAILVFWSIAAVALFTRDLLPDLIVGPPPDLRTIARAEDTARSTRWAILVDDDRSGRGNLRAVGQVVTRTSPRKDGSVQFTSDVWFDSGDLLRKTPFEKAAQGERMEVKSTIEVDAAGNLQHFRSGIRPAGEQIELLVLDGRLHDDAIKVQARGPVPALRWTRSFPYQARGVVHNTLGPLDRLPGLQVGQRWESQVVHPLTNQVVTARVEVAGREYIHWDTGPVLTLKVVTHLTPLTARTWVRPDGLVLKQEVPLLFLRLMLERIPESDPGAARGPEGSRP